MDRVISINKLLADEGFVSEEAQAYARALLERHGLTSARKQNIARDKLARAQALFADAVCRVCDDPDCVRLATMQAPRQEVVIVTPQHCAICGGSSQRRAGRLLAATLSRASLRRIVILGGTPQQHAILRELFTGDRVELRTIDGSTRAHSAAEAAHHLGWAQLLVIWASTPLHHKVSVAYTSNVPPSLRVITVTRRGVESLCRSIADTLTLRSQ